MSLPRDPDAADVAGDDVEVVDAEPVAEHELPRSAPAAGRPADSAPPAPLAPLPRSVSHLAARGNVPVAAQAAAVAVTGFAAGAVTAAVVRGASRRRAVKAARRSPKAALPVLGTRSFLVDVHLLGPRD